MGGDHYVIAYRIDSIGLVGAVGAFLLDFSRLRGIDFFLHAANLARPRCAFLDRAASLRLRIILVVAAACHLGGLRII